MKNIVLILSSGIGKRCSADIPKQFLKIAGKYIIEHTIELFENNQNIHSIIVVSHADYINKTQEIVKKNNYKKVVKIVAGGETRQDSSYIGVNSIEEDEANVLIHDVARPFTDSEVIDECIQALNNYDAVSVAVASPDTIAEVDENNCIVNIPQRKHLRRNQTPQAFKLKIIKQAHQYAKENNIVVTDDCSLVQYSGVCKIYIVNGNEDNCKITYPSDIPVAEKIYELKRLSS